MAMQIKCLISHAKRDSLAITAHTHSLNPVPFLIYDPLYNGDYRLKPFGQEYNNNLSNIAATNFLLLGQAVPDDLAPSLFED